MISLLMLGSVINYLNRSTLAVAAQTLLNDLYVTDQQYSEILTPSRARSPAAVLRLLVEDAIGLNWRFFLSWCGPASAGHTDALTNGRCLPG
jgi:ACS family hexuronate transporter-like MFS transporter